MDKSAPRSRTRRSRIGGFSMVELAVSMTVLLILTAIAIPNFMRSLRIYQLNDMAARLSDMLKFTRFEAVRRNKPVCFRMQQQGSTSTWTVGTDSNCSGAFDATGRQQVITGFVTLLDAGTPPAPTAITTALNVATLTVLPGNPDRPQFDARGAVRVNGALTANVYVFYIGAAANPDDFGYRAVILLPSGATQIWSAPAGGPWQRSG